VPGSTAAPAPIVNVAGTRAFVGTWLEDDLVVRGAEADRRLVAELVADEALPEVLAPAPVDVADVEDVCIDVVDVVAALVAEGSELPQAATNSAIGSARNRRQTRLTFPA
jgi:hypothetical protein